MTRSTHDGSHGCVCSIAVCCIRSSVVHAYWKLVTATKSNNTYSQGVTMTNTTHPVELIIKNKIFWLLMIAQTTTTDHFYEKRGHFFVRQFVERLHVKRVTLPKLEPPCHQNLLVQLLECRAADL